MVWKSGSIDLPLNTESLLLLVTEGERGTQSQYSHWDIVQWCHQFTTHWANCCSDHVIFSIADEVVVQWELYLARQYTLEQMQRFKQSDLLLSRDLFSEWKTQIEKVSHS